MNRRQFAGRLGAGIFVTSIGGLLPRPLWAESGSPAGDILKMTPKRRYNLDIAYKTFLLNGEKESVRATAINGTVPGPLMHWREGDTVDLNVTNSLMDSEHSSIHWHGILVPFPMDGVPGVNFAGIKPGETYKYRYKLVQSGTCWYHSHPLFQEQTGTYGPLVIEPRGGDPIEADRDYTVMLSDWTSDGPDAAFRHITMNDGYYNYQQ